VKFRQFKSRGVWVSGRQGHVFTVIAVTNEGVFETSGTVTVMR
jgi:hypothetical protein